MMRLWSKIKFHPFTLIFALLALISGLFKYVIIVFTIVSVHEIGHIIVASLFKRKISKIEILPFGGMLKLDAKISEIIEEDLLIAIAGIANQLFLGAILFVLYKCDLIDKSIFDTITFYNKLIIGFNLIPICPLDGYKIVKLLEEMFIPYKMTFTIGFIISMEIIVSTVIFKPDYIRDNSFVFAFLIASTVNEFKNRKHMQNRFYLERSLERVNFEKDAYISKKEQMYKNRHNVIEGIEENRYLKSLYLYK